MPVRPPLEEVWEIVRSIPPGMVASYGDVGRMLHNPASGYFVGRWMTLCPPEVPWWRVVAKDGRLPVWKRDIDAADEQRVKLEEEGVEFVDDRVDMERFRWELL